MHVGALVIFEGPPPARDEFCAHLERAAAAACRATARSSPSRRSRRAGRSGSTTRASTSTTTCATRRCRSPAATTSCASSPARIFSQRLDRSKPLWEIWIVQGLEDGRFALISKTHHALVDGVAGVDIATVLFDLSPVPAEPEAEDDWTPAPEPSDVELVAEGVKGLVTTPFEPGGRALGALQHPGATIERVREAAEGLGEVVWAGLNPAPDVPLNVRDRPAPARALGAEPPGRLQGDQERARRHRQRRRAGGRGGRARAAGCARRGVRTEGARAARARAGVDPRRGRARRARQPDRGDARAAARLRRTTPSSACGWCARRWAS